MSPRTTKPMPLSEHDAMAAPTATLLSAKNRLEALEAVRPWATRAVLAAVAGDQPDVIRRGVRFVFDYYMNGNELDTQRARLREAMERKAPDFAPFVEKLVLDRTAAFEAAGLILGMAIGLQLGATVDDLKSARALMAQEAGGIRARVAEARKALDAPRVAWRCDGGEVPGVDAL